MHALHGFVIFRARQIALSEISRQPATQLMCRADNLRLRLSTGSTRSRKIIAKGSTHSIQRDCAELIEESPAVDRSASWRAVSGAAPEPHYGSALRSTTTE
jgi:hypothetical protein